MADVMTHEQRSRCMAAIKSKGTKPEMEVRRFLFSKGLRYRVNNHKLPGSPDIVLKKNIELLFLLTGASGMGIKDASIIDYRKPILIFGDIR